MHSCVPWAIVAQESGFSSRRLVWDHLKAAHGPDLCQLSDVELDSNDLYICCECNDQLLLSLNELNKHARTHHMHTRLLNNLHLVESKLFTELIWSYTSEWSDGLAFLKSFKLTPPPFRQLLTTKIKYRLEESICDTFFSVIAVCNEGLKPHPNPKHPKKSENSSWELLLLIS
jgi:hypothetical protein